MVAQLILFFWAWLFWFILIAFFAYAFQKILGGSIGKQERMFIFKISFLCAAAGVVINAVLSIYRAL